MLQRLDEQQVPITAVLQKNSKHELSLLPTEWTLLKQLVEVLKPFDVATTITSYDQNISLSFVVPTLWKFRNHHLVSNDNDPMIIKQFKDFLALKLKARFSSVFDVGSIAMFACILDPR